MGDGEDEWRGGESNFIIRNSFQFFTVIIRRKESKGILGARRFNREDLLVRPEFKYSNTWTSLKAQNF